MGCGEAGCTMGRRGGLRNGSSPGLTGTGPGIGGAEEYAADAEGARDESATKMDSQFALDVASPSVSSGLIRFSYHPQTMSATVG